MVNKNYCFLNFIYAKIKKYDKIIYVDILYIGSGSMDQKRIGNLIKELRKKNNIYFIRSIITYINDNFIYCIS